MRKFRILTHLYRSPSLLSGTWAQWKGPWSVDPERECCRIHNRAGTTLCLSVTYIPGKRTILTCPVSIFNSPSGTWCSYLSFRLIWCYFIFRYFSVNGVEVPFCNFNFQNHWWPTRNVFLPRTHSRGSDQTVRTDHRLPLPALLLGLWLPALPMGLPISGRRKAGCPTNQGCQNPDRCAIFGGKSKKKIIIKNYVF